MPDTGDVLDGYRLDAVIGRGGMGTVYRATDLALEQTVALSDSDLLSLTPFLKVL